MSSESASATSRELWTQPNKFARPPGIEVHPGRVTIHGYQEFQLTERRVKPLPIDPPLRRKEELAGPFFNPEFLTGRTVLDIGANGGFFSFWACRNGARQIVSLDMDEAYLDLIRQAQNAFGWKNIRPTNAKVQDWEEPADLVLAFAMIHWLYSCTANYGSLAAVIEKLAGLTRSILLIEWVAPEDSAIQFFKHTEWNPQVDKAGYTHDAFELALRSHFCKVEILGATSPTRTLYAAYRQSNEVTLNSALPLMAPADRVLSSRWLTEHEDKKYYSRVYIDPSKNEIIKQATEDMALREGKMLERLRGPFFPRVISSEQRDGYSVLIMERIDGVELAAARPVVSANPKHLAAFIQECLAILTQLNTAGIRHRDIRPGNILVREAHPVLIDFGWAEAGEETYLTPGGLGGLERIKTGPPCDVYSMGKVFEQLIPRNSTLFAPLLQKMLSPARARKVPVAELAETLRAISLPDTWDVPLLFAIPSHQEVPREGESAESFWRRCQKLFR